MDSKLGLLSWVGDETLAVAAEDFKDHRQRIPKNCYNTIFRKINTEEIFFQLTLITNKDCL